MLKIFCFIVRFANRIIQQFQYTLLQQTHYQGRQLWRNWFYNFLITWNKKIGVAHSLNIVGGFTEQGGKPSNYGYGAFNLLNETLGISGLDEGYSATFKWASKVQASGGHVVVTNAVNMDGDNNSGFSQIFVNEMQDNCDVREIMWEPEEKGNRADGYTGKMVRRQIHLP